MPPTGTLLLLLLFSYYSTSLNILNGYSFIVVLFIKIIVQLSRSKILLGYGNLQDNLDWVSVFLFLGWWRSRNYCLAYLSKFLAIILANNNNLLLTWQNFLQLCGLHPDKREGLPKKVRISLGIYWRGRIFRHFLIFFTLSWEEWSKMNWKRGCRIVFGFEECTYSDCFSTYCNGIYWHEVAWNCLKWTEIDWNGMEIDWNGLK